MAQVASDADRERVRDVVRDVVYPADAAFLDALARRVPRQDPRGARPLVGARRRLALPDADPRLDDARPRSRATSTGSAWTSSRRSTPGGVRSPRSAGFGDDTMAYRASLAADPANTPKSKDELVDAGHARTSSGRWRSRRATSGRLPRAGCEVKAGRGVQGEGRPVRLLLPALDRRLAARHLLRQRLRPAEPEVHEARHRRPTTRRSPVITSRSRWRWRTRTLNMFRRLGSRMVGGAYVEGWGLYSEKLADEMGLFRNDGERFGMLDAVAWRAARLVVDTGLHALRWTRQQSIDFLLEAGLSETDATIETDRYIGWPGPGADLHDRLPRDREAAPRARPPATARRSTCAPSTTPSWATARCRSRRSRASSRTGSRHPPDRVRRRCLGHHRTCDPRRPRAHHRRSYNPAHHCRMPDWRRSRHDRDPSPHVPEGGRRSRRCRRAVGRARSPGSSPRLRPPATSTSGPLGPVADQRDGKVRLHLPDGFQLPLVPRHGRPPDLPRRRERAARAATTAWARSSRSRGDTYPRPQPRDQRIREPPSATRTMHTTRRPGGGCTTTVGQRRRARCRTASTSLQRHHDELRRRPDAVGRLDHLRGDRQRAGRRPRLHRRLEHPC